MLVDIERTTASTLDVAYASPAHTIKGSWFVAAQTPHGLAVWSTTGGPSDGGVGYILPINGAAKADAIIENGEPAQMQASTAAKDEAGIAAVTGCFGG